MKWLKRLHCPHIDVRGIYGDAILNSGYMRNWCADCGRFLDGPVSIAVDRQALLESRAALAELRANQKEAQRD